MEDFFDVMKSHMNTVLEQAKADGIFGAKGEVYSFNEWPDSLLVTPSVLIGTIGGDVDYQIAIEHHNIGVWVYFPKWNLSTAMGAGPKLFRYVRDRFAQDIQLNGTVNHCMPPEPPAQFYEGPGNFTYAGKNYVGMLFHYDVKRAQSGEYTIGA